MDFLAGCALIWFLPMERHHTTGEWRLPVFQAVEAFATIAEQLAEFAGSYFSKELDPTYTISVESGKLSVVNLEERKRPLNPASQNSFALLSGAQFEFNRDAQGRVAGFVVHAGRIRDVKFARR